MITISVVSLLNFLHLNLHKKFQDHLRKTSILSLKDREVWSAYLNNLPAAIQDVYFTPEYYEIYEKLGDGKAYCFIYDDGNNVAMYPFLINRINDLGYELDKSYYDIQGAYGYNGVLSTSDDSNFIECFYDEFNKYCTDKNIIAEFTRFHPILKNHMFSKNFLNVIYNRKYVFIDSKLKYDEIYMNFHRSVKTNIAKAKKNNLKVSTYQNEFPYMKEFVQIYKETMDRVKSEESLYFNEDYFYNTFKNLPLIQFVVFKDELPIATSICLCYGIHLHIHFTGSRGQFHNLRPNDLLWDEMIKFGVKNGYHYIHFGGGKTEFEDDSLLRFKKNYSNTTCDFYIGKKIFNAEIYNKICEQWYSRYPHLIDKYKSIALKYRCFC